MREEESDFREMESAARIVMSHVGEDVAEKVIRDLYRNTEMITERVVRKTACAPRTWQRKIDDIVLSRRFGYPIMVLLLGMMFWLTIIGANIPSVWLGQVLFSIKEVISEIVLFCNVPLWLHDLLIYGMMECLMWVIAVMLPPMVIFFTLFTLLEDLGYLPRIALNLDSLFYRACACGKQALTMCMGFGCNAAGVVACRIINSPRERILAMVTNSFVPCNGRFPTLILLATLLIGGVAGEVAESILIATCVTGLVVLGIGLTFVITRFLAKTLLQGEASTMVLELPPYRVPSLSAVLYRSLWERTRFVLMRAVIVAIPAGAFIWLLAHTPVGEVSLLLWLAQMLDPLAWYIGLDGAILLAFILGMPANEIVLPILMMIYLQTGQMMEIETMAEIGRILELHGWNILTLVNTGIFCLFHWPCATTLLSVYQESRSFKWTLLALGLPMVIGVGICAVIALIMRVIGVA